MGRYCIIPHELTKLKKVTISNVDKQIHKNTLGSGMKAGNIIGCNSGYFWRREEECAGNTMMAVDGGEGKEDRNGGTTSRVT